ncbi:MAG: HAD-IA family hydrolase [Chloroflexota bacterium]
MIKAVLLDLDNTLILNPDRNFASTFLEKLSAFFERHWQVQNFGQIYRDGLRHLHHRSDYDTPNMHALAQFIAAATRRTNAAASQALTDFYQDVYPSLAHCVTAMPGAHKLIETLQERGYRVVIASNPIYPVEAVLLRLKWAGLPHAANAYDFVSSADNMHFIKPNAAFFAEIIARVGIEPDETVIIGDRYEHDIRAASMIGIHGFLLDNGSETTTAPDVKRTTFEAFSKLVYSNSDDLNQPLLPRLSPGMIEPQYRGNIGALFGLIDTISPRHWHQHPDPNEWSPIQIVCHLLESENTVQRPRLERILHEDNPFLTNPKPPPGADQYACSEDGIKLAQHFASAREHTIALLRELSSENWQRPARHSIFGPTTLLEMAHFTAQHDRLHLEQLCQTVGRCT